MSYDYDIHSHHELIKDKTTYLSKGLSGLMNLGNKCFMNSIIQCLSHTLRLSDYFLSGKYRNEESQTNKKRKEYFVVLSYLNLIINLWESNQVLRPKSFVENMSKFIPKYFTLNQQDSHECLMYILDFLHRGMSYEIEVDISGTVKNKNDELMKQSLEQWRNFYEKSYSFIIETFGGIFYNKINCNNCPKQENVFEPFNCISVNIPQSGSITLKSCLDEYFKKEEKIESWCCENCKGYGCSKSIKTWSFPNYVIIHFKRFTNDGNKIYTHVDFPVDDLDLTSYISPDKADPNNYIYSLYAVNYHSGDTKSGHYWSSCKNIDKNWYLFNDSDVSKIQDTKVVSKDAYILFYYRKFIK